ncbi:MAG: tetratricopeptide repeat protein [Bacteroidales bacterium]|nr:tetratricopeptide repeat protein [Bacteroidales bacterium]MBK9358116.1 tetratricopeptide repeat protein [Bacteroidales bacterium]
MKKLLYLLLLLPALTVPAGSASAQAVTDEQLGLQYFNAREFEKSAALFERLFEEKPTIYNYTYLLQSLLEINDLDKAEKIVKRQAKKNPDDSRYIVDQGYVLIRSNQSSKASKLFDEAIRELPADQRRIAELANAFQARRENDYAIRTYMRGRQLLSPTYTFGFELANLYEAQGSFDKMTGEYIELLETRPDMQMQVQDRLQNSLNNDPEGLKSEALRTALLKKVQKSPDDVPLSEMMLWLSVQLKDFDAALIQARALDRRLSENGSRVFALGLLCVSNGNYSTAAEAFTYVIEKSKDVPLVLQSRVELLKSEYELVTRKYPIVRTDLVQLEGKYIKTLDEAGRNPLIYPLIRNLAHLRAFYLDNTSSAIELLEELIGLTANEPVMRAECKLELADIYLFTGDPWEATLLFSQVDKAFKNEPIGHEARFRNARLSFYIGEFDWARAQLDVLKAATSKLIANDAMSLSLLITDNIEEDSSTVELGTYTRADLLLYRNQPDAALAVLDSLVTAFPVHSIIDDALMKKAEILMKQGNFSMAETLYQKVISDFGDGILGDDALFNLAQMYDTQLNDPVKAMAAYQELLVKYPGSLFTVDARKRFRVLRGDQVN